MSDQPQITPVEPRARRAVELYKVSSLVTMLMLDSGAILLYKGLSIAVRVGDVVFYNCKPGAERRAVNAWVGTRALIAADPDRFDFTVGQVLTQAGLPLTTFKRG